MCNAFSVHLKGRRGKLVQNFRNFNQFSTALCVKDPGKCRLKHPKLNVKH